MFSPFTLGRRAPSTQAESQRKVVPLRTPQPVAPPRDQASRTA